MHQIAGLLDADHHQHLFERIKMFVAAKYRRAHCFEQHRRDTGIVRNDAGQIFHAEIVGGEFCLKFEQHLGLGRELDAFGNQFLYGFFDIDVHG